MFSELKKYKDNGHFFFERGQTISNVSNAPVKPYVYYIVRLSKATVELVYIGASATVKQDGTFSKALLPVKRSTLTGEIECQQFFEEKITKEEIVALDIYWFVTFDKKSRHLPSYVKALLLQKHFDLYGCLPCWNTEF